MVNALRLCFLGLDNAYGGFPGVPCNQAAPESDIEPQSTQRIGEYGAGIPTYTNSVLSVASVVNPVSVPGAVPTIDNRAFSF